MRNRKAVTPSLRHSYNIDFSTIGENSPLKGKTFGKKNSGGRNNLGKATLRYRGGGHKKKYRTIDFLRFVTKGLIQEIEFDPNRGSNILKIFDPFSKLSSYILASFGSRKGDVVNSLEVILRKPRLNFFEIQNKKVGDSFLLKHMLVGDRFHCLCLDRSKGGQYIRGSGVSGSVVSLSEGFSTIKMPSGEIRKASEDSIVSYGMVSNRHKKLVCLGKAGRSRWLGFRPNVRGVAKNPVDHPHGGGEGKTSGGRPSVTPKGLPTKGRSTRSPKKVNRSLVISRKKKIL
jgi:large subunit ribosomal protein L2